MSTGEGIFTYGVSPSLIGVIVYFTGDTYAFTVSFTAEAAFDAAFTAVFFTDVTASFAADVA